MRPAGRALRPLPLRRRTAWNGWELGGVGPPPLIRSQGGEVALEPAQGRCEVGRRRHRLRLRTPICLDKELDRLGLGRRAHRTPASTNVPRARRATWTVSAKRAICARQHRGLDVDVLSALDAATDEFGRRLELVGEEAWTLPTPCGDWDVHYLTAHVIGGNRFAAHILGGMPAAEAIEQIMSTPQIVDDATVTWAATCATQASAFHARGALQRRLDHPLGETSGREFLDFRIFDITLHAWDLARSIGADEQLAPDLVDVVLAIVADGPPGMGFGITAIGRVPSSASPQAKLLDLTGRAAT